MTIVFCIYIIIIKKKKSTWSLLTGNKESLPKIPVEQTELYAKYPLLSNDLNNW